MLVTYVENRELAASRLAFKICFLAPCLWWESENTHVYFWTSLFSIAPSFSIILPNWAICAKVFYCFDRYVVFSLRCARWFNHTTVLSVQCYSRCGSLSFHGFGLKTADFSLMESYNRIECFLLRVLTDLFYLSLEVLVRWGIFWPSPYIVGFLGKFLCPCAFLKLWSHLRLG